MSKVVNIYIVGLADWDNRSGVQCLRPAYKWNKYDDRSINRNTYDENNNNK